MVETQVGAASGIVCRPSGRLDWIGAVSLRHAIHDSLQTGLHMIIDLSRVDFIDAVGTSALVGSVRRCPSGRRRSSHMQPLLAHPAATGVRRRVRASDTRLHGESR